MPKIVRETDEGLVMENQHLIVRFCHRSAAVEVFDRRVDFNWKQSQETSLRAEYYAPGDGNVSGYMQTGAGLGMRVIWELDDELPEIRVQMQPEQETSFETFTYPAPFLADNSILVVPHSQGILYPVEDYALQRFLNGQILDAYTSDLSMPFFGMICLPRGHGVLNILETPEDASVLFGSHDYRDGTLLTAQPAWRSTMGNMGYDRRLRLYFHAENGYLAQAKRYQEYLRERGRFPSPSPERAELLRGAAHVAFHIGQLSFEDVAEQCERLKSLGVEKAVIHLRNWQQEPYNSPEQMPPSQAAGGEEGLRSLIDFVNHLGYVPGMAACFRDTFDGFPGHVADAVTKGSNGNSVYGGFLGSSRVPALRISGDQQVEFAEKFLPPALEAGPFDSIVLDGACVDARENYDKKNRSTRGDDIRSRKELLEFAKNSSQLLGAEGSMEFGVGYADFLAGQMSLARYYFIEQAPAAHRFNLDPTMRIPLFNLVYHEAVVSTWHHQDSYTSAEDNGVRALFDFLYGNPPVVTIAHPSTLDNYGRRLAGLMNATSRVHLQTAGQELLLHGWLTDNRLVQLSHFGNGLQVVANFSREPFELPSGDYVEPGSCKALLPG
ncbi:MAG: DUF5696 domain-containing protein [Planctomycetota bacterium]|nr:DUF5696 domain-containing protein [Planctomycetota bacterium]MDA1140126.1 DUF5696 domain-containing protein [Planctomycetota bacterium]